MRKKTALLLLYFSLVLNFTLTAQVELTPNPLPDLPDKEGFAGMFAGVSGSALFCMGGANFPGKRPWEGGTKKWYSNIYKLERSGEWKKLPDTLPTPLAYGVSVSVNNKIYLVGGNSDNVHTDKVICLSWNGDTLLTEKFPSLPFPLANMTGAAVGNLIIVAGGSSTPTGPVFKRCIGIDITAPAKGWFELPAWPGPGRSYPVCAVTQGKFYLFSGERVGLTAKNQKYRYILQDAYSFTPQKVKGKWTGTWHQLAPLPKGAAAAGSPVPVLRDGSIVISGGVDPRTALHTDPSTHPGISRDVQVYNTKDNSWQLLVNVDSLPARVTLPIAYWNQQWVFISGEVKPGVRTNKVVGLKN